MVLRNFRFLSKYFFIENFDNFIIKTKDLKFIPH